MNEPNITIAVFTQEGCGPCRMLKSRKLLEQFEARHPNVKHAWIGVEDRAGAQAAELSSIRSTPTLIFFEGHCPKALAADGQSGEGPTLASIAAHVCSGACYPQGKFLHRSDDGGVTLRTLEKDYQQAVQAANDVDGEEPEEEDDEDE